MKDTVTYLLEPFLTQFFLLDSICRGLLNTHDLHDCFKELARVFCVPLNKQTNQYLTVAEQAEYKNIVDQGAYERFCRILEFALLSEQDADMTAVERVVLAQKREAMLIKSEIFKQNKNLTADSIADTLFTAAAIGNTDAMAILAFMEYHGICICRDTANALARMALCGKWNHLFGNLMGLAYDTANTQHYGNTLYTILRNRRQREVFRYICTEYVLDNSFERCPEAAIIEDAIGLGIIKKNTFDRQFAKAAFSELLSAEDKETLLLNNKQGEGIALPALPFDADRSTCFVFDAEKAKRLPVERGEELNRLLCSLHPAVSNRPAMYKPLLVAGNDEFVADMYLQAVKAGFCKNKIIEVDAGLLTPVDLSACKENFLLRGLAETKQSHTIFLLKNCENLNERELEELTKLLHYENRRKFRLAEPAVCADLSDVLIILFASAVNDTVKNLALSCDAVWTERISEDEKDAVIDSVFSEHAKAFGIGCAKLDEQARKYLAAFKTQQIFRMLDGALKRAAFENDLLITQQTLKTVARQQNFTTERREFGYVGGMFVE